MGQVIIRKGFWAIDHLKSQATLAPGSEGEDKIKKITFRVLLNEIIKISLLRDKTKCAKKNCSSGEETKVLQQNGLIQIIFSAIKLNFLFIRNLNPKRKHYKVNNYIIVDYCLILCFFIYCSCTCHNKMLKCTMRGCIKVNNKPQLKIIFFCF